MQRITNLFSRYHQRESIRLESFQTSELDVKRTEFGWTWFCGCDDEGGAGDAAGGVVVVGKKCMMVVIGMMILYLLLVENFILAISWKTHTDRHEVPGPKKSKEGDG